MGSFLLIGFPKKPHDQFQCTENSFLVLKWLNSLLPTFMPKPKPGQDLQTVYSDICFSQRSLKILGMPTRLGEMRWKPLLSFKFCLKMELFWSCAVARVRMFGQKEGAPSRLPALPPISLRVPVLPGWGLHFPAALWELCHGAGETQQLFGPEGGRETVTSCLVFRLKEGVLSSSPSSFCILPV